MTDANRNPSQNSAPEASSPQKDGEREPSAPQGGDHPDGLGFVMDVPVELTVEIGRRVTKIGDILRLRVGSILELSKAAGEPLDLYVNNHPIARGEAVVIGDRYGVRVTEVFTEETARRNGGLK